MSIIKHVTLQKIVAHDFRYDPRRTSTMETHENGSNKVSLLLWGKKYLNTDTKSTYFTHNLYNSTQNTNMPRVSSDQKCVHYGMKCSLMKIAEVQFLGNSSLLCIDVIINRVV